MMADELGGTAPVALPLAATALAARPARWRIGLIALATDHTTERDFAALSPDPEVAVYVNRVAFENPVTRESLCAMLPRLSEAAALILPGEPLDALAYGCTAASAMLGDAVVREALQAAKPEVPVVTPTAAALAAFAALDCTRIGLLTPYDPAVTEALAGYFGAAGLEVVKSACLGLADDREIARVEPAAVLAAAQAAAHPAAQALFISCTALRAVPVLQRLEERLGLPVVSSNQALYWRCLRLAGCALPVSGHGRLLL